MRVKKRFKRQLNKKNKFVKIMLTIDQKIQILIKEDLMLILQTELAVVLGEIMLVENLAMAKGS